MGLVCVVGSINLDVMVRLETYPAVGETVLGEAAGRFAGGKGLNQALAAHRSGATTRFCALLGDDADGQFLRATVRAAGLDDEHIGVSTALPSGVAQIALLPGSENSIIVAQGANTALSAAAASAAAEGADVVLVQLEIAPATAEAALAAGRSTGAITVLNAAPAHGVTPAMLRDTDVLVVNESEAEALGGLESLLRSGPDAVIVTLGSRGSVCMNRAGERIEVPACSVQAVDTTGAGDAFCGALAASLAAGSDLGRAMRVAAAAGAIIATQLGAQSSQLSESSIERMLAAA